VSETSLRAREGVSKPLRLGVTSKTVEPISTIAALPNPARLYNAARRSITASNASVSKGFDARSGIAVDTMVTSIAGLGPAAAHEAPAFKLTAAAPGVTCHVWVHP